MSIGQGSRSRHQEGITPELFAEYFPAPNLVAAAAAFANHGQPRALCPRPAQCIRYAFLSEKVSLNLPSRETIIHGYVPAAEK